MSSRRNFMLQHRLASSLRPTYTLLISITSSQDLRLSWCCKHLLSPLINVSRCVIANSAIPEASKVSQQKPILGGNCAGLRWSLHTPRDRDWDWDRESREIRDNCRNVQEIRAIWGSQVPFGQLIESCLHLPDNLVLTYLQTDSFTIWQKNQFYSYDQVCTDDFYFIWLDPLGCYQLVQMLSFCILIQLPTLILFMMTNLGCRYNPNLHRELENFATDEVRIRVIHTLHNPTWTLSQPRLLTRLSVHGHIHEVLCDYSSQTWLWSVCPHLVLRPRHKSISSCQWDA